ncbi:MAG: sensor histidine kinase [Solirubrobacteraceae bacterium]
MDPAVTAAGLPEGREALFAIRLLGLMRLLLLPVVLVSDRLVSQRSVGEVVFDAILGVAAIYSVALLALQWRRRRLNGGAEVALDLTLVCALALAAGRAFSDLRPAFFVIPLGAAIALTPRRTALISAVTVAAYLIVGFTHPTSGGRDLVSISVEGLYVVWVGIAAVVLAFLLGVRRRQIMQLARSTGSLVAQAVDAEERAQRQVSDALHDHALQNLLTARQDLEEARAGDTQALDRAGRALALAVEQVRSTVQELHPYVIDHLGLPSALTTIATHHALRGGYRVEVSVQPAAVGIHDALIASVARELLINATRHAAAANVTVRVAVEGDELRLRVADDGRGCTPQQRAAALREGHIGLAASRERLLASSGRFEIDSAPGAGTVVTCALPLARSAWDPGPGASRRAASEPAAAQRPVGASAPEAP